MSWWTSRSDEVRQGQKSKSSNEGIHNRLNISSCLSSCHAVMAWQGLDFNVRTSSKILVLFYRAIQTWSVHIKQEKVTNDLLNIILNRIEME